MILGDLWSSAGPSSCVLSLSGGQRIQTRASTALCHQHPGVSAAPDGRANAQVEFMFDLVSEYFCVWLSAGCQRVLALYWEPPLHSTLSLRWPASRSGTSARRVFALFKDAAACVVPIFTFVCLWIFSFLGTFLLYSNLYSLSLSSENFSDDCLSLLCTVTLTEDFTFDFLSLSQIC